MPQIHRSAMKWSPLRQEPEAPSNNATSRNCALAPAWLVQATARVSAFHPRREPGDAKARDSPGRTATDDAALSVLLLVALFFFGCAAPTASLDPKPLFDPNPLLALDPLLAPAHLLAPSPLLSPLQILDQTPLLAPIKILEPAPLLAPPALK